MVRGWTHDGRILFVTTHGQPFFRNYRAYTIDPSTAACRSCCRWGRSTTSPSAPATRRVIGRNTADPARWKRYRGGTAGHLWIDAQGDGAVPPDDRADRQHHQPDVDRRAHLLPLRRRGRRQHLFLPARRQRPAAPHRSRRLLRAPRADRRQAHRLPVRRADLVPRPARRHDAAGGHRRARASHAGGAPVRRRRRLPARVQRASGGPQPRASTCAASRSRSACGKAPCGSGAPTTVGAGTASGWRTARRSSPSATPRARSGWRCSATATARTLPWDIGRIVAMARRAARRAGRDRQSSQRGAGRRRRHRRTARRRPQRPRSHRGASRGRPTAPGSRTRRGPARATARSSCTKSPAARRRWSTQPDFRDYSPAFDPAGKYLYFLSVRTFDPVYDSVQFELSFPRAARPYLIALQADGAPPFEPPPRAFGPPEAGGGRARRAPRAMTRSRQPQPAWTSPASPRAWRRSRCPKAATGRSPGSPGNKVLWTHQTVVGAHGRGGHKEAAGRLELFDFATLRAETMLERVDRFVVNGDGTALVARDGKKLRAVAADRKPEEGAGETPSRKSGWIDLGRIRASVDAAQRVAADAARGVAAAARPLLDGGHVGRRLERDLRSLRAAARPRGHARRALRPHLGDAGRARHLARLRDGRRPPQAAGNPAGTPGRRAGAGRRRTRLRDRAHRRRRRLGSRAPTRRSMPSACRRASASASWRSTASRFRARCHRRRCSCTRRAPRSS